MSDLHTVVIADDHPLIRDSVVSLLESVSDFRVVGAVGTADEALRLTATERPDVVVLDINMPGIDAYQAAGEVSQIHSDTKVLFLTAHESDTAIERATAAGAVGFVSKYDDPGEVVTAIREALAGRTYFSESVRSRLATSGSRGAGDSKLSQLSARELETLRYVAKGLAKKEIAPLMHISVKTVDKHVTQLMSKLGIHDRVGLARYAIREGIVEA